MLGSPHSQSPLNSSSNLRHRPINPQPNPRPELPICAFLRDTLMPATRRARRKPQIEPMHHPRHDQTQHHIRKPLPHTSPRPRTERKPALLRLPALSLRSTQVSFRNKSVWIREVVLIAVKGPDGCTDHGAFGEELALYCSSAWQYVTE